MQLTTKLYIILTLFSFSFYSCNKEKLKSDIPSYITINEFAFSTDYVEEGSNSENITDAWVYINDNLIGVYELPATFPVLLEGNVDIKIFPGVKENGISNTRVKYPFYTSYQLSAKLNPNEEIEINPITKYRTDINFLWMEDFENAGISFLYHNNSDTIINKTNNAFEGNHSGYVTLTGNMNFFECFTTDFSTIPRNNTSIFVELDFKTNHPILVGVYGNNDQVGNFYLNIREDWTKIYLNLTELINTNRTATTFKVFFGFEKDPTYPTPQFYLDNVKLIHFDE